MDHAVDVDVAEEHALRGHADDVETRVKQKIEQPRQSDNRYAAAKGMKVVPSRHVEKMVQVMSENHS